MTKTLSDFEQIIDADFEFISRPGERPDVVCLAWREWPSGQTHCLWRDQLGATPPYRTDDCVLFRSFVFNAEGTSHLSLDWPLPANVIDLSAEFRLHVNGRTAPDGKGLLGALAFFNLPRIDTKQKEAMRDRIQRGWPFTGEEREQIKRYAVSDIDSLSQLSAKLVTDDNLERALHYGEFVAGLALMEHRGVPIDKDLFSPLVDKRAWSFVRDAMTPTINAAYGVYIKGADGDWHFSLELFDNYLRREGMLDYWPLTETGKLSTQHKVFENMAKGYPQLENLRQLRYVRGKLRKIKLAVGADSRNRTTLWPFKSKTSRTQPKAAQ